MICNLIRLIVFVQLLAFCSTTCQAAVIWTYDLTNLGPSGSLGNPYSVTKVALMDGGVSFNATLIIVGSRDIGYQLGPGLIGGLGVTDSPGVGNTLNGSNGAEFLRFSLQLTNITGGSVAFNGFSIVGFNGFGGSDLGVLSLDDNFSTSGDNTLLDDLNGSLPSVAVPGNSTAFSVFSNSGSQHFQVSFVTGSFTGTAAAVPEPSTFLAIVFVASATPGLRRFRRRTNSVDSGSLVA
jgi:hypothetical protein